MFLPLFLVVALATILVVFLAVALLRQALPSPPTGAPATPPLDLAGADRYSRRSIALAVTLGLLAAAALTLAWEAVEPFLRSALAPSAARASAEGTSDTSPYTSLVNASLHLGLALAPGTVGLVGTAVLLLRDRRSPLTTSARRTATLAPRRVRDYVSRPAAILASAATLMLASLAAIGLATSSPDGRCHRWAGLWTDHLGTTSQVVTTHCPWPGLVYVVPALVLLTLQLALGVLALRDTATRGQLMAQGDGVPATALDHALRRRSADAVLGLLVVSTSLTTIAYGLIMGPIMGEALGSHPLLSSSYVAVGLWSLTCAGLGLLALGAGVALFVRQPVELRDSLAAHPHSPMTDTTPSSVGGQR